MLLASVVLGTQGLGILVCIGAHDYFKTRRMLTVTWGGAWLLFLTLIASCMLVIYIG
jgi:hypothetical protein